MNLHSDTVKLLYKKPARVKIPPSVKKSSCIKAIYSVYIRFATVKFFWPQTQFHCRGVLLYKI